MIGYNKEDICDIFHMPESGAQSTYIGLPNIISLNKTLILYFLKEKVRKCI